jgi:hypothetical protein
MSALPARSVIEPACTRFSCNVPEPDGVPVPVEAVIVRVVPLPVTAVIVGVPDRPVAASEKLAATTPLTASPNVTVQDTEAAFVGEAPLRTIDTALVVGGVVSNVYGWPVTGTEARRALPAASWIVPFAVRFSTIEPLLLPVVPDVEAVTVHALDGADPVGAAAVTVGVAPPRLLVTSVKLLVATFLTGSLNVTVQRSRLALVGFASARTIEETVGAVRSITHEYDAALLVWPLLSTDRTWNVCDPGANPEYVMPVGQVVNETAVSRLHRNPFAPGDE